MIISFYDLCCYGYRSFSVSFELLSLPKDMRFSEPLNCFNLHLNYGAIRMKANRKQNVVRLTSTKMKGAFPFTKIFGKFLFRPPSSKPAVETFPIPVRSLFGTSIGSDLGFDDTLTLQVTEGHSVLQDSRFKIFYFVLLISLTAINIEIKEGENKKTEI